MSRHAPSLADVELSSDVNIAIVAARFNEHIVGELLNGCLRRLKQLKLPDANVHQYRVPGAFELALGAKLAAQTRRYDAIICLGTVIRGDTPHFEYVAGECARGIQQVSLEQSIPVIFGVLTTNSEQQAKDRVGGKHGHAGERAADAAAEMIRLGQELSPAPAKARRHRATKARRQ